MGNIDAMVTAAKAEIEAWSKQVHEKIQQEHDEALRALREQAKKDLDTVLANALATYRRSLEDTKNQREGHQKKNPEIAQHMEKFYALSETSAKKYYDGTVQFLKDMYRNGLGIE